MKILIVAATNFEIENIQSEIENNFDNKQKTNIEFLVTGIGIHATTYCLTKYLISNKPELVINIGICGSFNRELNIGDIVNITEEQFGDLGIIDKNNFCTLFDFEFLNPNQFPYNNQKLISNFENVNNFEIKHAKGITVNTCSGEETQIRQRIEKFNSDVESMEGAAVFYVCLNENIPVIQIRAISNYVEERNKLNWNIPLALQNLTKTIKLYLTLLIK